jgi:hypothetical protein
VKFGTELKVFVYYANLLYNVTNVPIKAPLNCSVFDIISEFFFSYTAERISSELASGWFGIKNCGSNELILPIS